MVFSKAKGKGKGRLVRAVFAMRGLAGVPSDIYLYIYLSRLQKTTEIEQSCQLLSLREAGPGRAVKKHCLPHYLKERGEYQPIRSNHASLYIGNNEKMVHILQSAAPIRKPHISCFAN